MLSYILLFNANKKDFSVLPDGSLEYTFTEHTGARCAAAERKTPLAPIRQKIGTADQVRIAAEVSIEPTLSPVGSHRRGQSSLAPFSGRSC